MRLKDLEKYSPVSVQRKGRTAEKRKFWHWAPDKTENWLEQSASEGRQLYLANGDNFYFAKCEPKKSKYHITYGASMPDDVIKKNRDLGWNLVQVKGSAALWVNECTKSSDPVFEEKSLWPTVRYFLWNTIGYIIFIALFLYIIITYLQSEGITMENFSFILVAFSAVNICAMFFYIVKLIIGLSQIIKRNKSEKNNG